VKRLTFDKAIWKLRISTANRPSLQMAPGRLKAIRIFESMSGGPAGTAKCSLERMREACFKEFTQLGRSLELWDRLQFLECRSKRVRDGSRSFVIGTPHTSVRSTGRGMRARCLGASSLPSTNAS